MSESYQRLEVAREGGALTITLAYPERRNAIGPLMTNELLYALGEAREDAEVRVVVLTGKGKAFCAGGDFAQMTASADAPQRPHKGDYVDLLRELWRMDKPVINQRPADRCTCESNPPARKTRTNEGTATANPAKPLPAT